jgi:PhzF family phenazine biosynthesis protein
MIPYYQISAFTRSVFGGNPAGVCLLETALPADTMQQIAHENDLAETAFVLPREDGDYDLRWFTPTLEIDLCGHATLASAHALFAVGHETGDRITFHSLSGPLVVSRTGERLVLDFPSRPASPGSDDFDAVAAAIGITPQSVANARDMLVVIESETVLRDLTPDIAAIADLDTFAVIITAPGDDVDFVSRFFAPRAGVDEDPVTGSAHTTLIPYWADRLGKVDLTARQISRRGGDLFCRLEGDRVKIGGYAVTYFEGSLSI